MFRTACLLLLFTAELFFWMNKTDAFTIPCEASLKTVKRVTRCPSDSITYDEAVKAKNCSAVAAEAHACSSFEYHCVLSEDYEYAVEVCAPSFLIIGRVCAMFNRYRKGILRIEGKNCKECPYNYSSTFAYQYAECYANITKYYRKEIQQSSESTPTSIGISKDENMKDELNTPAAVLGSIAALLLVLLLILLVFFLRWKKRKGMPKDKNTEEMQMLTTATDNCSNNTTVNGGTGVHGKEPMQSGQEMTSYNVAVNGGPGRFYEQPLPSSQEISSNNVNKENRMYEDQGVKIKFTKLSNYLAESIPTEKLNIMRDLIIDSGYVKNKSSIENADSTRKCLRVLKDENLFTPTDVIFVQFLCRESNCSAQYEKCLEYAQDKKALCFYEKQTDDGSKNIKFHVQGILSNYNKKEIQEIKATVASIIGCDIQEVVEKAIRPSKSFLLILSMKEIYAAIMSELAEKDRLKLMKLNIDYLIDDLDNVHYMCSKEESMKSVKKNLSEYEKCIQRNFTFLEEELPEITTRMVKVLNVSNLSDISSCTGRRRQLSKLLKIILMEGRSACMGLFRVLEVELKRTDLIQKMKCRSTDIEKRGKPILFPRLRSLNITCLQKYEEMFYTELEPLDLCDLLFEESAIEIPAHDKITETRTRVKQTKYLLETVQENKNDCFHFFLYILQREEFQFIRNVLEEDASGIRGAELNETMGLQLRWGYQPENVAQQDFDWHIPFHDIEIGHTIPEQKDSEDLKTDSRGELSYEKSCHIVTGETKEMVDPVDIHIEAVNIKKKIKSNYKDVLEEMQNSLIRETLSNCSEDVAINKKIPGTRKQRMNEFLKSILNVDSCVISFEKTLRQNGLDQLLGDDADKLNTREL